jgi:hypothetical protein
VDATVNEELDVSRRKEGVVEVVRFEELKAKAAGEGLTDEEAAELGRLYAEESGEPYHNAKSMSDADASSQDQESLERRKLDAGAQADAMQERDRSQAIPTGEAREPDHE